LLAFDQGAFTFIDVHHGQWPIILITNPKIPWLTTRDMETEEDQIANSRYIRLLQDTYYSIDNTSRKGMKTRYKYTKFRK